MIEQIKKDLRAQVEECFDLNHKGWHDQEGVLLSGAEALALLGYIEGLESLSDNKPKFEDFDYGEGRKDLSWCQYAKALDEHIVKWVQLATRGQRPDKEQFEREIKSKSIEQLLPGANLL